MTRRGKRVVLICILITVASAVIIGYGVGKLLQTKDEKIDAPKISEVIEDECTEEYKEEQNVTEVNSTEEKVSSNAILILKKYYIQCDHTINEYVELPQELVNMTKEQVQAHYPDWEVIGFEKGKISPFFKKFFLFSTRAFFTESAHSSGDSDPAEQFDWSSCEVPLYLGFLRGQK